MKRVLISCIILLFLSYSVPAREKAVILRPSHGGQVDRAYLAMDLQTLEKTFTRKVGQIEARWEEYAVSRERMLSEAELSGWDKAKIADKISAIDTLGQTFYVILQTTKDITSADPTKWTFEVTDGTSRVAPEILTGKEGAAEMEKKGNSPMTWKSYISLYAKGLVLKPGAKFLRLVAMDPQGGKSVAEWRFK
jgi:hypothetical protein